MVEDNQDEAEVKLWIKYGIRLPAMTAGNFLKLSLKHLSESDLQLVKKNRN